MKNMTMKKSSKNKYIAAIGRRKTATARVRLYKKKGPIIVNGQPIGEYFPGEANKVFILSLLKLPIRLANIRLTLKLRGQANPAS